MDENRLTGYAGLPIARNPYVETIFDSVPAVAALAPRQGVYTVVFDSASRGGAGRFGFRFWVDDVTPPTLRLRTTSVPAGSPLLVGATDRGSGVCPNLVTATIDGRSVRATFRGGVVRVATDDVSAGRHRLRLRVSDYQETKNTENVPRSAAQHADAHDERDDPPLGRIPRSGGPSPRSSAAIRDHAGRCG